MQDMLLLDCTLRDGGYINTWNWGFEKSKSVIQLLVKSSVDIVEVGFLRNIELYDKNVTVSSHIEDLNTLLPEHKSKTMFAAMAMQSNYDIAQLSDYSGSGIELIRVTAHEYDIQEGMEFARKIKNKGYKVSINPINIMGYTDEQIIWILKQVNDIQPYQFSIVDTFGSMKRRDLDRIVSLVDNNLTKNIRVALHLHENMSLSTSLAQAFVDKHLRRPMSIDGSLMGIGRIPGNLPIELIADYLNEYIDKSYDIDYLMDAIQDYIFPLKKKYEWGYTPTFFLSARFNVHRNYAEHYLTKGDLTNRDIDKILSGIDRHKASVFDAGYADELYINYKNCSIDDSCALKEIERNFCNRDILILAPGKSLVEFTEQIKDYYRNKKLITISVNFLPEIYDVDYVFFSNSKRYYQADRIGDNYIVTSNIKGALGKYILDYDGLAHSFDQGNNGLIMLLSLLKKVKIHKVVVAGADGYLPDSDNYYKPTIRCSKEHEGDYNKLVAGAIKKLNMCVKFITPSKYCVEEKEQSE